MPLFTRQALLNPEQEDNLKAQMLPLWNSGMPAKDIAQSLQFGVKGTQFEKVLPQYVYYYRLKFNKKDPQSFLHRKLPPRKQSGLSRYKHKQEKLMTFEQFQENLNAKASPFNPDNKRKRSYLIVHFWSPLRASELYERTIKDFELTSESLIIHLKRKKKKYKLTDDEEPLEIPLSLPLMNEVVQWLCLKSDGSTGDKINLKDSKWVAVEPDPKDPKKTAKKYLRPWQISDTTAWKYVNSVFKGFYPHYFRFRFVTDSLKHNADLQELKDVTGMHLVTLNEYVMKLKSSQSQLYKKLSGGAKK